MGISRALYFAAIVPPAFVREEVKSLKLEFRERFAAFHALKLPAHLTVIPPLWLEKEQEKVFLDTLEAITSNLNTFPVQLRGFGHFGQRAVFIKVQNPEPVKAFYQKLNFRLKERFSLNGSEKFHPHLTLATRDLTRENFDKAWEVYRERNYTASFQTSALTVFKHEGKIWEIIREFPFRQQN